MYIYYINDSLSYKLFEQIINILLTNKLQNRYPCLSIFS